VCGLIAVFGAVDESTRQDCLAGLELMRHRGPDDQGVLFRAGVAVLGHRRLAIMDPPGGRQPIVGAGGTAVVHNGEIYNWRELRRRLEASGRRFTCMSDSEVLVHLFETRGDSLASCLDGDFAFAALRGSDWLVARDPLGVKPLYYGEDSGGRLWFASEIKALQGRCAWFKPFPPGHTYSRAGGLRRYYSPGWLRQVATKPAQYPELRERFEAAVEKRLMSDVPLGALLSGGIDSSLVTAVAARLLRRQDPGLRLPTFSVGVHPQAPDLRRARDVADHVGSDHHEVVFDHEEGIARLSEIIYHLESYDVSLVRGSVPMYFLMREVRSCGVKVVLAGDGSDEVFGGYLYLYSAPDTAAFHEENLSLLTKIHTTELPTLDKLTMQHSVEARVPFLDTEFVDVAMAIAPDQKRPLGAGLDGTGRVEKWVLRTAFSDDADAILPDHVLWRQKEAFEDGVGYSWIDQVRNHAECIVPDREFSGAAERFPHNTPMTKEAFLYRKIFSDHFPGGNAAHCVGWWTTKWQADADPSGRASQVHNHPRQHENA
jgi:asparagine synthase (glutamine-hydrolysing)